MTAEAQCARIEPRTNMFVIATVASSSATGPVRIRNMSPGGALIEGAALPGLGDRLVLQRGRASVSGKVVWHRDGRAGVMFEGQTLVSDWLPAGSEKQKRVDETFQKLKTEVPVTHAPPRDIPSALPTSDVDLMSLARAIDALSDDLAGDPGVVARHALKLQTLDLASQVLRKLGEGRRG